ncbi:MAG: choice-of-anchor I family protein [Cytophagales bacterium]|nr:choice-of-anchor I family protein [Bernardetiaceae bacterium]MDW8211386.1 choice-of-anchor I family protein [Cytophagales bacterium]
MKRFFTISCIAAVSLLASNCSKRQADPIQEDVATFKEIGRIDLGSTGAAEIAAYDPKTKRLFIVNVDGGSRIDVIDLRNPTAPVKIQSIDINAIGGGGVNSVAVSNGLLAAAVEAPNKTDNGRVIVFNTETLNIVRQITVGALPDMITFSPDGNFILTANEGEPNEAYTIDPVGSVSIIAVNQNYAVTTLDFSQFASNRSALEQRGLRIYGRNASFAQDMEPEYIAVSDDSKTAWVTLQENNAIARIDLTTRTFTGLFPLGTKDHNAGENNKIDASDRDNIVGNFRNWPVQGYYQPDAIAFFTIGGMPYLITANEGDARAYEGYNEERRAGDSNYRLDPTRFPNAAELRQPANIGRLRTTAANGDIDGDGDYDIIYTYGTRSFSIWNANTLTLVSDVGKDMEERTIVAGLYDDTRSDDKGVEPEAVTIADFNGRKIAFIGLERADAVLVYDVTNPTAAQFIKLLPTGDAPEGVLYISPKDSPNGRSLLIATCEGDGLVNIYQPETK